jgi:antitoxin ParD1/3/4
MAERADSGETAAKLIALDIAITRGLNDAELGLVKPSSEVFDRLEATLAGRTDRAPSSERPKG